jgi:hypothetical protein
LRFGGASRSVVAARPEQGNLLMSIETILLVIPIIALLGGFSGIGGVCFTEQAITAAAASVSWLSSCWSWLCSESFDPTKVARGAHQAALHLICSPRFCRP